MYGEWAAPRYAFVRWQWSLTVTLSSLKGYSQMWQHRIFKFYILLYGNCISLICLSESSNNHFIKYVKECSSCSATHMENLFSEWWLRRIVWFQNSFKIRWKLSYFNKFPGNVFPSLSFVRSIGRFKYCLSILYNMLYTQVYCLLHKYLATKH